MLFLLLVLTCAPGHALPGLSPVPGPVSAPTAAEMGPAAWPPPPAPHPPCPAPEEDERRVEELRSIYAGRNWTTLRGEGLRLHVLAGGLAEGDAPEILAGLERAMRRAERFFDHRLTKPADVFVYGHPDSMDGLADGTIWPRMGAIFSSYEGGPHHRLRAGAGHLLAHLFARTLHPTRQARPLALLEEGVARLLEAEAGPPHVELAASLRSMGMPLRPGLSESDLAWGAPLAAEKGHSLAAFIRERFGDEALLKILKGSMAMSDLQRGRLAPLAKAVRSFLRVSLTELVELWSAHVETAAGESALAPAEREACRIAAHRALGLDLSRIHFAGRDRYRRALAWATDGRWIALREGRSGWEVVRAPRPRVRVALGPESLTCNRFASRVLAFHREQAEATSLGDVDAIHGTWAEVSRLEHGVRDRARHLALNVVSTTVEAIRPALVVESVRLLADGRRERVTTILAKENEELRVFHESAPRLLAPARLAEVGR